MSNKRETPKETPKESAPVKLGVELLDGHGGKISSNSESAPIKVGVGVIEKMSKADSSTSTGKKSHESKISTRSRDISGRLKAFQSTTLKG